MTLKQTAVGIILVVIAGLFIYSLVLRGKSGEPLHIGVIAPLSGIVADYGEEIRRGVLAADVPTGIEFIFEDDQCDPKLAVSAFRKLVDVDKVKFIIGPGCGSPQEAITPLLRERDVIVLVPSAAPQDLYRESGGNLFNIQYSLEDESAFIAKRMYELGYKKVILITYQNAFSKTHRDSFTAHFQGEIVKEVSFTYDTTDVATQLSTLKSVPHDAIFSTDIVFFFSEGLSKLKRFGITTPVFSQYAVELPAVRPLTEGVIYSFAGDLLGGDGAVFALSKEAAELLAASAKECGGNHECVKRKIADAGFTDGVKQRPFILKKIENGKPVIY